MGCGWSMKKGPWLESKVQSQAITLSMGHYDYSVTQHPHAWQTHTRKGKVFQTVDLRVKQGQVV